MSLDIKPPPIAGTPDLPSYAGAEAGRIGLVDLVSGSFGAGHDAAAGEIARRLRDRGYTTRTWDIVDLMPRGLGRVLRAAYLRQIQSFPSSWSWTLGGLERHTTLAAAAVRALGSTSAGLRAVAADGADAFVSTHPFASQALGRLRADRVLTSPVITYLTDMSVHPLWVHPAVDLHLALHALPAAEARRRGAVATTVVEPAVSRGFLGSLDTGPAEQTRLALGLPLGEPLVLVTGGSCGIGDLERAAADIAATGLAVPVVLCGRNDRLLRRIRAAGAGVGLGWVDDMSALLNTVDAVAQNSGGFTSLESLAAGVPLLTYRCIAGHGETNAAALDRAGLVPWVRDRAGLATALTTALAGPRTTLPPAEWLLQSDVVDAITGAFLPARVA